mgnify:CR=1 FL=1
MTRDTLIEGSTLTAIADAIREKTETTDVMYPSEMAGKIREISTGGIPEPITAGEFVAAVILDENTAINYHLFFKKRYLKYKFICHVALDETKTLAVNSGLESSFKENSAI